MSFSNFIRSFGSVLNLSPAPSHFTPTVDGAVDKVMSRFEHVFSRPEDQPVLTLEERRVLEAVNKPTDIPNTECDIGSTAFVIGKSNNFHGPGVRHVLDPMKDLEPQIREAIRTLQMLDPLSKPDAVRANEARTGEGSAMAHPNEGGEAKA